MLLFSSEEWDLTGGYRENWPLSRVWIVLMLAFCPLAIMFSMPCSTHALERESEPVSEAVGVGVGRCLVSLVFLIRPRLNGMGWVMVFAACTFIQGICCFLRGQMDPSNVCEDDIMVSVLQHLQFKLLRSLENL